MKLYFAAASPFVRKVLACAIELGLDEHIERLPGKAHPINRDATIIADNPLGQVPTFVTDDGMALYDSRVICEYLDDLAGGDRLFPKGGARRWRVLVAQALGDGLMNAAILARYETILRPQPMQFEAWLRGQMAKIDNALDGIQQNVAAHGEDVDIGTITAGCALGYLDFRFSELDWRASRPALARWFERFSQRPGMVRTAPSA